ncbi:lipoprotein [Gammaproteobacteria bacterium]|nr:lipoprotein [Gammaproteobacteria bacterium]MDA9574843.1 lipoprotein [Gammaproteobacteria bacterium]MDA9920648.1 lipoprotein [Gammaproteobacteria bacterium]MDC0348217.1 lipoprotein [Gammaproteobacteria bacterium]MDC0466827.1 lipoprotein [Gammaproteobacteria bacterium]
MNLIKIFLGIFLLASLLGCGVKGPLINFNNTTYIQ